MPHARTGVWEEVHLDFQVFPGADPDISACNLVAYDAFTHYLISIPMEQVCLHAAADHVYFDIILIHGRPKSFIFDSQLDVDVVTELMDLVESRASVSFPYAHNGVLCERPLRFLTECMRAMFQDLKLRTGTVDFKLWKPMVLHATQAYNSAMIPTTLITPFEAHHSRPYVMPLLDAHRPQSTTPDRPLAVLHANKIKIADAIRRHLLGLHLENSASQALQANRSRTYTDLQPGTRVTITNGHTRDNRGNKLDAVARPDFTIINKIGNSAYRVRSTTSNRTTIRLQGQVHSKHPRPNPPPTRANPHSLLPTEGAVAHVKRPLLSLIHI